MNDLVRETFPHEPSRRCLPVARRVNDEDPLGDLPARDNGRNHQQGSDGQDPEDPAGPAGRGPRAFSTRRGWGATTRSSRSFLLLAAHRVRSGRP